MLKNILSLIICGVFFMSSGIFLARAENNSQTSASLATHLQNVGNKICPVSGEKIEEKIKATYEYNGKVYNFCCASCIEEFKENPAKYIKIIEEEKNNRGLSRINSLTSQREDCNIIKRNGEVAGAA